jgi:FkbM family methyltransferase
LRLTRIPPGSPYQPERFVNVGFDFILGHYLLRRDPEAPFVFIEIGAFDGVTEDPIHDYVMRFGWRGVLLEPQLRYFTALQETYRDRPELVLLNAALDRTSGTRTLYRIDDPDAPGMPEWAPETGSFLPDSLLRNPGLPNVADRIVSEPVETITFQDVLAHAGTDQIDLIQIDAECYDAEIIEMIDFDRVRPPIIRFEHEGLSRKQYRGVTTLLCSLGYSILPELFDTVAYLF